MSEAMKMVLMGTGALLLGISGWVLPYDKNLLMLKRSLRTKVSEGFNRAVPKVMGTLLILGGIGLLIGGLTAK